MTFYGDYLEAIVCDGAPAVHLLTMWKEIEDDPESQRVKTADLLSGVLRL